MSWNTDLYGSMGVTVLPNAHTYCISGASLLEEYQQQPYTYQGDDYYETIRYCA